MESLVDTRIGHYVLTRALATGGMAGVFEATDSTSGARVAIKILRRDLRRQRDPLARIMQEGRVICSLLHEHVVRVLDYGTAEESIGFIVMELLEGRTLADLLDAEAPLAPERAAFIARQICSALAAAHARGVYHRDIKPANIFLVDNQRHRDFVKVVDFGIAKLDATDPGKIATTATGMTLGTPEYMSPEQATAGAIDARSDLYQVGLVMYEMLVGRPPFVGRNPVIVMKAQLNEAPVPVRRLRPDVPPELERIVMTCLEKEPDARYHTAEALEGALHLFSVADTANDGYKTVVPSSGDVREQAVVGNLRLPALGSPGDLERYGRNLRASLERLWPDGQLPDDIRTIQPAIADLTEAREHVAGALAEARAETATLARDIEGRLRPIERALQTLEADLATQEAELAAVREQIAAYEGRIAELDAEYARRYDAIEARQGALYHAAAKGAGSQVVDFRDLFREDIAAELESLERIYRKRSEKGEALDAQRHAAARQLRQLADLRVQLNELRKSRLNLESEQATILAEREHRVADLENRHRALERALEHRHLQLGLAVRRAIARRLEGGQ